MWQDLPCKFPLDRLASYIPIGVVQRACRARQTYALVAPLGFWYHVSDGFVCMESGLAGKHAFTYCYVSDGFAWDAVSQGCTMMV